MRNQIKHILNKPGSPWENAYVEGQHRLDQERFYSTLIVHNEDPRLQRQAGTACEHGSGDLLGRYD